MVAQKTWIFDICSEHNLYEPFVVRYLKAKRCVARSSRAPSIKFCGRVAQLDRAIVKRWITSILLVLDIWVSRKSSVILVR